MIGSERRGWKVKVEPVVNRVTATSSASGAARRAPAERALRHALAVIYNDNATPKVLAGGLLS